MWHCWDFSAPSQSFGVPCNDSARTWRFGAWGSVPHCAPASRRPWLKRYSGLVHCGINSTVVKQCLWCRLCKTKPRRSHQPQKVLHWLLFVRLVCLQWRKIWRDALHLVLCPALGTETSLYVFVRTRVLFRAGRQLLVWGLSNAGKSPVFHFLRFLTLRPITHVENYKKFLTNVQLLVPEQERDV